MSSMKYVKSIKNLNETIKQTRYAQLPKKGKETYYQDTKEDLTPQENYTLKRLGMASTSFPI